jgi:putative toxin-antitoxin system antitoxin component (TIGR02293 family)
MPTSSVIAATLSPAALVSPLVLLGLRDFTVVPTKGHQVIKRGISSRVIEPVSQYLGLGKGALAEFMDLDRGTATRLSSKGQDLPSHAAETLLRLLEIHDMAADVFATEDGASTWLRTPHPLLDSERPLDAAKTSYGAQTVKNLLMSTKYGGAA